MTMLISMRIDLHIIFQWWELYDSYSTVTWQRLLRLLNLWLLMRHYILWDTKHFFSIIQISHTKTGFFGNIWMMLLFHTHAKVYQMLSNHHLETVLLHKCSDWFCKVSCNSHQKPGIFDRTKYFNSLSGYKYWISNSRFTPVGTFQKERCSFKKIMQFPAKHGSSKMKVKFVPFVISSEHKIKTKKIISITLLKMVQEL